GVGRPFGSAPGGGGGSSGCERAGPAAVVSVTPEVLTSLPRPAACRSHRATCVASPCPPPVISKRREGGSSDDENAGSVTRTCQYAVGRFKTVTPRSRQFRQNCAGRSITP